MIELVELRCKSCGALLRPEDIVERLAMARCSHCDAVFGIEGWSTPTPSDSSDAAAGPRIDVPMPRGFQVQNYGNVLEISRRWFHPMYFALIFFCIFWNGFMLVWHGMALASGAWLMSLFGLLHTAVGVGLAYATVAGFVNRTIIRVGHGQLEVRHGPLPWLGNRSLPSHEIEQIYCQEAVSRNDNGSQYRYTVYAILQGNHREKLLAGLIEAEQALYVEQELERFLNIKDRPVRGELPR